MIDAQVHLLDPKEFPYPADSSGYVPRANEAVSLPGLLSTLDNHAIAQAVLVQASVYGSDNRAILAAAAQHPKRLRAVVMVNHPAEIEAYAAHDLVVGIRLNTTDYAGHRTGGIDIANQALQSGLIVQLQALPEDARRVLDNLEPGPVILDHLGRPDLRPETTDVDIVAALSQRPDTWLKVSGVFRLQGVADDWQNAYQRLTMLTKAFGSKRLLWGSDLPYINISQFKPSYEQTLDWGRQLVPDWDQCHASAANLFGWAVDG